MNRVVLLLLVMLAASSAVRAQATPVVVLGRVRTADSALPVAQAAVLQHGVVISLDRARAEAAAREPGAIVLRVPDGGIAMPGIVESHAHLLALGRAQRELDLSTAPSLEAALQLVRERAAALPAGAPLLGRGWNQELWPEKVFPNGAALDAVAPGRLVLLSRVDGHAIWVNSAVLQQAKISSATPSPSGGEIVLAADGTPTGVLVDNAMALVDGIGNSTGSTVRDFFEAERSCLEQGITTFVDAGESIARLNELSGLYAAGKAKLRVCAMIGVDNSSTLDEVLARAPAPSLYGDRVSVRMAKLYADGSLGSRGAWLLQPYSDRPGHSGFPVLEPRFLRDALRRLITAGWQVCVHCIGDRAVRETLDSLEAALVGLSPAAASAARPRIEHAQHIHPADFARFKRLGVIPSMQPCHASSDGPWVEARLGAARANSGAYAWRTLLDSGCRIPCGTDAPVELLSPWRNFHAAVTRQTASGAPFTPAQCMTRAEALLGITAWGAHAVQRERTIGMLRPGMAADLIVLDRDPLRCAQAALPGVRVLHTVIAGEVVHSAQD